MIKLRLPKLQLDIRSSNRTALTTTKAAAATDLHHQTA